MQQPHIIFISGTSGAGKTALVKALALKYDSDNDIECFHFDSIGVPSLETMIKEFGSGKAWQKAITYRWVKEISENYPSKKIIIIEGQTEFTFIKDALKLYNVKSFKVALLHANAEIRHKRLLLNRKQPELINPEMDNWEKYLYNQAIEEQVIIIDNSFNNLEASISAVESLFPEK